MSAASRLFRELQVAIGKVSADFAVHRHAENYRAAYVNQQRYGIKAFKALLSDYEELTDMLVHSVRESTGIWLRAP